MARRATARLAASAAVSADPRPRGDEQKPEPPALLTVGHRRPLR